ncbi:MAG: MotA/TolQ/ExbB proton channel family protein [Candidatus Delongbacteria bacterium]|nr:MotA/TolQ/ExbB proton channel family protein [Candidatus Delongbacteria bacterium]
MSKFIWFGVVLIWIVSFQHSVYSQNRTGFMIKNYDQVPAIDLNELKKMIDEPISRDGKPPLVNKYLMEYFADFDLSWNGHTHIFSFRYDLPHAGSDAFVTYIDKILQQWTFPDNPHLEGCKIRYSIHADKNDGFIKISFIDNQNMTIPNLILTGSAIAFGDGYSGLIKATNFKSRNLILPSLKKDLATFSFSWWKDLIFNKLQVSYSVIFIIIIFSLIGLFVFIFYRHRTDKSENKKLVPIMALLWENSVFHYQTSIQKDDGQSEIILNLTFDIYSKNNQEKLDALNGISECLSDPDNVLNHLDDIKSEEYKPKNLAKEQLVKLNKDLGVLIGQIEHQMNILEKIDPNDHREVIKNQKIVDDLFEKAYATIWHVYTKPHLMAALRISKLCERSPMARILESGIRKHLKNKYYWYSFQEITRAVNKKAQAEMDKMNLGLDWVWTISGFAPMLGLLGTVTGIEQSFDAISKAPSGLQDSVMNSLASGINEALYTTIIGLIIGVFATLLYYWFKTRIDENSFTWESVYQRISERI